MAKIYEVENEFVDYIRQLIEDRMDELEGEEFYSAMDLGCDIASTKLRDVPDHYVYEEDAIAFISSYPTSTLGMFDYVKWNFGEDEIPTVLSSWATVARRLVEFGVRNMLADLDVIQELGDEGFTLTEELIEAIDDELDMKDSISY